MVTKVTITGADDSIRPENLIPINKKYSFVEWGILVSKKHFGINRFPSLEWINELAEIKRISSTFPINSTQMNLSCHLCGMYVRELAKGNDIAITELGNLWNIFERVQINFHGIKHETSPKMIDLLLKYPEKEFIFQYDNVNSEIVHAAHEAGVNCSALFDTSGGIGRLPESWPNPLEKIKCGYAGGISPENIEEQIKLIESKVGNIPTWIDMETHVRSFDDSVFDLQKVTSCLEISSKFVQSS